LSHIDPISSLIRGTLEATLIDEGFEQAEGVAKIGGPVLAEAFDTKGEELGSKVRDFNIGQDGQRMPIKLALSKSTTPCTPGSNKGLKSSVL